MTSPLNGQQDGSQFMNQMLFALGYAIESKKRVIKCNESMSNLTQFVNQNLDKIRNKLPKLEKKVSKNPEKYKDRIIQLKTINKELKILIQRPKVSFTSISSAVGSRDIDAFKGFVNGIEDPHRSNVQVELFSSIVSCLDNDSCGFTKAALEYLVGKGFNPKAYEERSILGSLLFHHIGNGHSEEVKKRVECFLEVGADPHAMTSGTFAVIRLSTEYPEKAQGEIINSFLQKGFDTSRLDKSGNSIFHHLIDLNKIVQLEKWMCSPNADLNVINVEGNTPFHCAIKKMLDQEVRKPHLDSYDRLNSVACKTVYALLEWPIDVNKPNRDGDTPLLMIIKDVKEYSSEKSSLIEKLIEKGADPFLADHLGVSPIEYSLKQNNLSLLKSLTKNREEQISAYRNSEGKSFTELAFPISGILIIEKLEEINSNNHQPVFKTGRDGTTRMMLAAQNPSSDVLNRFFDGTFSDKNSDNRSALHFAAMNSSNHVNIALIKSEVNKCDCFGNLPLHYAVIKGDTDSVKVLLQNCSERDVKNKEGKTPLDLAREGSHVGIVKLLIHNAEQAKKPKTIEMGRKP